MINLEDMNSFVKKFVGPHHLPGVAVAVEDESRLCVEYGYADEKRKIPVDERTLFEIGSMSKAFIALAILWLSENGKLSLDDNVNQYIPWFRPYYSSNGKRVAAEITISDLVYHTSGIPFQTLFTIPSGHIEDALKKTVWKIRNVKLVHCPGSSYHYASNNYNILAYIIEIIEETPLEDFMKEVILHPLNLYHTYLSREEAEKTGAMSKGYKLFFFRQWRYNAPVYKGNTGGGYIISCIQDMERWVRIQMGLEVVNERYAELIRKSHIGKISLKENPGYKIAAGWHVNETTGIIQYMGSNPNYSSKILINLTKHWGICVLANTNSSATYHLADNILKCAKPRLIEAYHSDLIKKTDLWFSVLCVVLLALWSVGICFFEALKESALFHNVCFFAFCLFVWLGGVISLPYIFKRTLHWKSLLVWASPAIPLACFLLLLSILAGLLFCFI